MSKLLFFFFCLSTVHTFSYLSRNFPSKTLTFFLDNKKNPAYPLISVYLFLLVHSFILLFLTSIFEKVSLSSKSVSAVTRESMMAAFFFFFYLVRKNYISPGLQNLLFVLHFFTYLSSELITRQNCSNN